MGEINERLSVRLPPDLLALLRALRGHYPGWTTTSDLVLAALRIGALVLASGAQRPGQPRYGGLTPEDLRFQLRQQLAPALALLGAEAATVPAAVDAAAAAPDPAATATLRAAGAALQAAGVDWLD
jgi:hypothetical protein